MNSFPVFFCMYLAKHDIIVSLLDVLSHVKKKSIKISQKDAVPVDYFH